MGIKQRMILGVDQVLFQLLAMLLFEHGWLSGGKIDWLQAKTFACPQRKSCRRLLVLILHELSNAPSPA